MRLDRAAHIPWVAFCTVATATASFFYAMKFHPQTMPAGFRFFGETPPDHGTAGGTPLGLVFGAIALAIFVFAALLGVRKKLSWLPVGNVNRWLRGHIWLTLLTIPLILLHSGFRLGGPMTTLLMVLYAVVMLSGIYGLVLQNKLPTAMKERLPAEIVYEQIPNIRAQLCAAAEKLLRILKQEHESAAATVISPRLVSQTADAVIKTPTAIEKDVGSETIRGTEVDPVALLDPESADARAEEVVNDEPSEQVLAKFVETRLLPYLRARRGDKLRLGHAREAAEIFLHLKSRVAANYRVRVDEMEGWCDDRRLLDLQTRYQHWLHGWLLVHVPLSFLLLLMTVWHAFVTLFRF